MSFGTIFSTVEMAAMAVVSVGLWTLRVALTARGRRIAGSVTAGAEAIVFLLAFSALLADLDAIERIVGYALGVAAGTLLGVVVDEKMSAGQSEVRIVAHGREAAAIDKLQSLGWPVTWTYGSGPRGDVTLAFVAVDDVRLPRIIRDLERHVPEAFWTVERLKTARPVRLPVGFVQVRGGMGSEVLGKLSTTFRRFDPRRSQA